jgi:2-dehydro-3-deoxygluconokinase
MTDLLTFGETMGALRGIGPLRLGGSMELSIAGSESNVAIAASRLGHSVEWIGRVGNDELGQLVLRTLRAEGVHLAGAIVDDRAPTGALLFERRIADLTRVTYFRAGSAGSGIRAADIVDRLTSDVSLVHLTGVTAALGPVASDAVQTSARTAQERGISVSLDVNFRSRLWTAAAARAALRPLVPHVDIVFASEDELPLVAPDADADADTAARQLLDEGTRTVVVKRGAAGATAYSSDGKISTPARTVPVVDVVGAGDAFVGGYLSAHLDGLDTAACLERGVVVGAFAVSRVGDWEGLPTRDDLTLLDAPPGTTIR